MQDFDHTQIGKISYWFIWVTTMLGCKVVGFFDYINIELPVHDIKNLPQLNELIPALIIASACAVVSAIMRRLIGMLLNKIKFFKKK
jgi:hypothetical protein